MSLFFLGLLKSLNWPNLPFIPFYKCPCKVLNAQVRRNFTSMIAEAVQESVVVNGSILLFSIGKILINVQVNFSQQTIFCTDELRTWLLFMLVHDLIYSTHLILLLYTVYTSNSNDFFRNHYLNEEINLDEVS